MRRTAANTAQYAPLSRLFVAVRTPSPTQSRRRRGRCVGDHADGPYKTGAPGSQEPHDRSKGTRPPRRWPTSQTSGEQQVTVRYLGP
jgi:hypothetical protein